MVVLAPLEGEGKRVEDVYSAEVLALVEKRKEEERKEEERRFERFR